MPDMRISLMKGETIPRDIKGRRIICCFCNDKGTWDTKTLEKFAKRFPEAKEWYLHKLPEQLRYPGQVLFCPGNNENTIVAIMICSTETADKYGSKIQFPYLYGCLLQAMVKAKQAEASVIVSKLGTDMVEWQWRKLIWILNHAAEMNEGVTAIAVSPYDLSDVFVEPKKKKSTSRKTKAKKIWKIPKRPIAKRTTGMVRKKTAETNSSACLTKKKTRNIVNTIICANLRAPAVVRGLFFCFLGFLLLAHPCESKIIKTAA